MDNIDRDSLAYKFGWSARGAAHTVAMGPAAILVGATYAVQGTKYAAQTAAAGWRERGEALEAEAAPYVMQEVSPEIHKETVAKLDVAEAEAKMRAAEVKIKARTKAKAEAAKEAVIAPGVQPG